MMNRKELVAQLRDLGYGRRKLGLRESRKGVCALLSSSVSGDLRIEADRAMDDWPEHSGRRVYPVPYRGAHDGPRGTSEDAHLPREVWAFCRGKVSNWSGPYGCARRRLCLWIADCLAESEGFNGDD